MIAPSALALAVQSAQSNAFQAACQRLVGRRAIAVVAVDPRNGQLLALVHPELASRPYPPGSVFKLVTSLCALRAGVAPPTRNFDCAGTYHVPGVSGGWLNCSRTSGHGRLSLEEAIARSCNVTFYGLGVELGGDALKKEAIRCGLLEAPGTSFSIPRDLEELAEIGVGEGKGIKVTAEGLTGFVAALATGGPLRQPTWQPIASAAPPLASSALLSRIRAGMALAVLKGTAGGVDSAQLPIAGKTGTSTYLDASHRTHGWFVGYAPVQSPRIVVTVFVREGTGYGVAAPLASRIFAAWLQTRARGQAE